MILICVGDTSEALYNIPRGSLLKGKVEIVSHGGSLGMVFAFVLIVGAIECGGRTFVLLQLPCSRTGSAVGCLSCWCDMSRCTYVRQVLIAYTLNAFPKLCSDQLELFSVCQKLSRVAARRYSRRTS